MDKKQFKYSEEDVKILADAIEEAYKSVDCDPRCFDWTNYNPDLYRKQKG